MNRFFGRGSKQPRPGCPWEGMDREADEIQLARRMRLQVRMYFQYFDAKLVEKYRKSPDEVVAFYLDHLKGVNNWDLVDLSAPYILGAHLADCDDRKVLYNLAESSDMWKQRTAMVSTLMLIRNGIFEDTLRLAERFLATEHDLIRKATGWMLREVGKRDEELLVSFLEEHHARMPRVMLRYAIERLPYLKGRY